MTGPESSSDSVVTCWTLIQGAAAGEHADRERFAHLYLPVIRAYLFARWRNSPLIKEVEDVAQDVFIECFREGGALLKVRPGGGSGGFRAFLHAVVKNVAGRLELKRARRKERQEGSRFDMGAIEADEEHLSMVFDRAWMMGLLKQAVARQQETARDKGEDAVRRVELLRLRFDEGMPIRDIAREWNVDAMHLHREYAKARHEFEAALKEVLAFHHPSNPGALEKEFVRLCEYMN